jgi:hypothetical protein
LQDLEVTSRYELAGVMGETVAPLFPVYLRGQAFLAQNPVARSMTEMAIFAN